MYFFLHFSWAWEVVTGHWKMMGKKQHWMNCSKFEHAISVIGLLRIKDI
jgi:hypothetical protein